MNLKKTSVIVIAFILITSHIEEVNAIFSLNNERSLVNDVVMVGLKENATLYIGSDLELKAFTNEEATIKDIEWLINKDNIVTIESSGNQAIIKAINEGEVSIMARAVDGSDSSRSINVKVRDYNKENNEINLPQGIVPIKCYGITDKVFQVEANRQLSSDERVRSIEVFLSLISFNGNLTLLRIDDISYDNYTIYEIQIGNEQNQKIEIRVDNRDTSSFDKINDILNNLENYQSEIPLTPGMVYIEGNGDDDNPYIVEANENLTSVEKIETVEKYLQELYKWGDLKVVDISESKRYTSYKIKVLRSYARDKNDFYIEIRVDKNDKDSYIPIITMLNKINKHNNNNNQGSSNNNNNSDNNNQGSSNNNNNSDNNNQGSNNNNNSNGNNNDINNSTNTDGNHNSNDNDNITNDVNTNINNNIDYGTNNLDEKIESNTTNQNLYVENNKKENKINNISDNEIDDKNNYKEKNNESVISSLNYSKEEKLDTINNSKNDVYNEKIINYNYKSIAAITVGVAGTGLIVSKNIYLKRKNKG